MKLSLKLIRVSVLSCAGIILAALSWAGECDNWQTLHPDWLFCDDFESSASLVGTGRYFEYDNAGGSFALADAVGLTSSKGMKAVWQTGQVSAGSLKLGFGRNPSSYMNKGIRQTEDFRDIYYRMYVKMQPGWVGNPGKLSRATVIAGSNWQQAMIAHLWGDSDSSQRKLGIDPARGVDSNSNVITTGYNDFTHLTWLGTQLGTTSIFDTANAGHWYYIEAHVKLNDPGLSNGIQEFWIDGNLESRKTGINFVYSYTAYAINAIFFENYTNGGSPQQQERYFDNIVVSTKPIGPISSNSIPLPPSNLKVQ